MAKKARRRPSKRARPARGKRRIRKGAKTRKRKGPAPRRPASKATKRRSRAFEKPPKALAQPKPKAVPNVNNVRRWASFFRELGEGYCRFTEQGCEVTTEVNSDGTVDADIDVANHGDLDPLDFLMYATDAWIWPGDDDVWIINIMTFRSKGKTFEDDVDTPIAGKKVFTVCTYPMLSTSAQTSFVAAHTVTENIMGVMPVSLKSYTFRLHWNRKRQTPSRPRFCL